MPQKKTRRTARPKKTWVPPSTQFPFDRSVRRSAFLRDCQASAVPYYFADLLLEMQRPYGEAAEREFLETYQRVHGLCKMLFHMGSADPTRFRGFTKAVHERAVEIWHGDTAKGGGR
jgi:hypothetical protein